MEQCSIFHWKKVYATNNESLNSYGSLSGISNIVKFYSANANSQMGCGITILAQDNEGNLYDLSTTLRETGNYCNSSDYEKK